MDWLDSLFADMDPLLRTYWYIAIPVSVVFVLQFIMLVIGAGGDGDFDLETDADTDGLGEGMDGSTFDPFTIKNLINFLLGFGWGGISFSSLFGPGILSLICAFGSGIVFVLAFFYVLKQVHKLSEDNTFTLAHSLLKEGEVYTNIPANMTGKGKVLVNVNGSLKELAAKTEFDKITPGTPIKVVGFDDETTVIVEPINLIE
jgi:hypothetical protein